MSSPAPDRGSEFCRSTTLEASLAFIADLNSVNQQQENRKPVPTSPVCIGRHGRHRIRHVQLHMHYCTFSHRIHKRVKLLLDKVEDVDGIPQSDRLLRNVLPLDTDTIVGHYIECQQNHHTQVRPPVSLLSSSQAQTQPRRSKGR